MSSGPNPTQPCFAFDCLLFEMLVTNWYSFSSGFVSGWLADRLAAVSRGLADLNEIIFLCFLQ